MVNSISNCSSFNSRNKRIILQSIISYFLDKHQKSLDSKKIFYGFSGPEKLCFSRFCGLKISLEIFKSFWGKDSLHTQTFSLQDSKIFSVKNNFLTKFEKSRLLILHTLISIVMMTCSLFFKHQKSEDFCGFRIENSDNFQKHKVSEA